MIQKSQVHESAGRLKSLWSCRTKVMIAGVLGGGSMIAFPAASAAVVMYVALLLGTIGLLALTGALALAPVVAAALIVPALTVMAILAAVDGVLWLMRRRLPPSDGQNRNEQPVSAAAPGCDERTGVLQEELDDWETDGGPAAPARRRVARRRVRRSHRRCRRREAPKARRSAVGRG
jgi:hypothetical protein